MDPLAAGARVLRLESAGSSSELAILDLAVALGENRYRLSIMGDVHSRAIAQAVARALGEDR